MTRIYAELPLVSQILWLKKRYAMATTVAVVKLLRRIGFASWLLRYRYLFPPVLINMVGRKR